MASLANRIQAERDELEAMTAERWRARTTRALKPKRAAKKRSERPLSRGVRRLRWRAILTGARRAVPVGERDARRVKALPFNRVERVVGQDGRRWVAVNQQDNRATRRGDATMAKLTARHVKAPSVEAAALGSLADLHCATQAERRRRRLVLYRLREIGMAPIVVKEAA